MSEVIRGVRPDEYDLITDLWVAGFGGAAREREFYANYFSMDPWRKDDYTRIYELDGKPVAAIQISKRPVDTPWGIFWMGGIGNVTTLQEYRGRGYNTALLKSCIDVMKQDEFDFSVLYTGITKYYARVGWEVVDCSYTLGQLRPELPEWKEVAEIGDSLLEEREWESVFTEFNRKRPITVVRDPGYSDWVNYRLIEARWLSVRDSSGRLIGYAGVQFGPENVNIQEVGWRSGNPEAATLLANRIAKEAKACGTSKLFGFMPSDKIWIDALTAAGYDLHQEIYHSSMWQRICMPEKIYQELSDLMTSPEAVIWTADHF